MDSCESTYLIYCMDLSVSMREAAFVSMISDKLIESDVKSQILNCNTNAINLCMDDRSSVPCNSKGTLPASVYYFWLCNCDDQDLSSRA